MIEVNDLSASQYPSSKSISFETPMLRSDLCDCNYAYILVKEKITAEGTNEINRTDKMLA